MSNRFDLVSIRLCTLVAPLTLVFFIPTFSDPFNLPKLLAVATISAVVLLVFPLEYKLFRNEIRALNLATRIAVGLYFSFIVLTLVTGLIATPNLTRAIWGTAGRYNGLLYFVSVAVLALAVSIFGLRGKDVNHFIYWMSWAGFILLGYSLIQYFGLDPVPWNNPYNPIIGTLGNPNFSAAALALISVFFLGLARQHRIERRNPSYFALNVLFGSLAAFLSWKTASLQGPLILLVGVALLLLREFFKRNYSIKLKYLLLSSLSMLGGFVLLSMAGLGPLGSSLEQYTLKIRSYYALIGLEGMLSRPWTGYGVDSYLIAFREFRNTDFVSTYGVGTLTNNAHSTPFQIGAVFGVFVFLIYLILMILILTKAVRILARNTEYDSHVSLISIMWILVFAQSLLSIEQIGLGVLNWIMGAMVLTFNAKMNSEAENQRPGKAKSPSRTRPKYGFSKEISIVLLAVSVVPISFVARADASWKNLVGLEFRNESDSQFVREQLSRLNSIYTDEPDRLGQILPNLQKANMFKEIEALLLDLVENNPEDLYSRELLASLYRVQGNPDRELLEIRKMVVLDPFNNRAWLRKGELELALGDSLSAKQSLTRVLNIQEVSPESDAARQLLESLS